MCRLKTYTGYEFEQETLYKSKNICIIKAKGYYSIDNSIVVLKHKDKELVSELVFDLSDEGPEIEVRGIKFNAKSIFLALNKKRITAEEIGLKINGKDVHIAYDARGLNKPRVITFYNGYLITSCGVYLDNLKDEDRYVIVELDVIRNHKILSNRRNSAFIFGETASDAIGMYVTFNLSHGLSAGTVDDFVPIQYETENWIFLEDNHIFRKSDLTYIGAFGKTSKSYVEIDGIKTNIAWIDLDVPAELSVKLNGIPVEIEGGVFEDFRDFIAIAKLVEPKPNRKLFIDNNFVYVLEDNKIVGLIYFGAALIPQTKPKIKDAHYFVDKFGEVYYIEKDKRRFLLKKLPLSVLKRLGYWKEVEKI